MDREARATARLLRRRAAAGGLWLDVSGDSMRPTLRPPARVLVEATERPRPGEVWAFVGPTGAVAVHRYLRRQRDGRLLFRGDAVAYEDDAVAQEQLVGRVRRAEREGMPVEVPRRLLPVVVSVASAVRRRIRGVAARLGWAGKS